jgi:hypothetical protein
LIGGAAVIGGELGEWLPLGELLPGAPLGGALFCGIAAVAEPPGGLF